VNIIIFGPPGAGKGTQADKISKHYNLFKVSTGDLLRNEISKKSSIGVAIEDTIKKGNLVSDSIINNLVEKILAEKKYKNSLIFDGYPRTINQVEKFENSLVKFNQKISCILSLNVSKNTLVKRIIGRQICLKCGLTFNEFFNISDLKKHACGSNFLKKRSDDNRSTIEARYETYLKQTKPIINFYKERNFLREVNGESDIASIYKEICGIISTLKG